jgi:hypothetical protein
MQKNFNRTRFEKILNTKNFDVGNRQSKELKELVQKFARNHILNSGPASNAEAELKQNHLREYLNIWIDSIIESFGNNEVTKVDEADIIALFEKLVNNRVESAKRGVRSAMASHGHTTGSIISVAQANISNKLYAVRSVCLDKLKIEVENHNDKIKTDKMNSLQKAFPKLEEEQIYLLCQIVEAHRNVSPSKRSDFLVIHDMSSDSMLHPGFNNGWTDVVIVYLRILDNSGLIKIYDSNDPNAEFSFTLTSSGFQYYEFIKNESVNPIERTEKEILSFINIPSYEQRYQKAFFKWNEAEKLLWITNNEINLSTVGHLCREAMQEFLEVLVKRRGLENQCPQKDKTKNRVQVLIKNKKSTSSDTIIKLLEKLYEFWDMLNELIQRQEHYGLKERETIVLDDAKRVVIYTVIMMNELDKQFY